jgi:hypothetical protein
MVADGGVIIPLGLGNTSSPGLADIAPAPAPTANAASEPDTARALLGRCRSCSATVLYEWQIEHRSPSQWYAVWLLAEQSLHDTIALVSRYSSGIGWCAIAAS